MLERQHLLRAVNRKINGCCIVSRIVGRMEQHKGNHTMQGVTKYDPNVAIYTPTQAHVHARMRSQTLNNLFNLF